MKKLFITLAVFTVFFYSCTKDEITPSYKQSKKDTIKTIVIDLKFKLAPIAIDQFKISIPSESSKKFKLILKKGNQQLSDVDLNEEPNINGLFSANVKYNFSSYELYNIVILASKENTDTVFQQEFTIPEYSHKYYNKFNYELLTTIHQTIEFDISPSRNVIYYIDYINNKCLLKRLSVADKQLTVVNEDFFSLLIRSISDDHLLVGARTYNNHFLGADSCALLNYDVNTKETSFIDWGSADYGRFSRVVNNSIMVTNPMSNSNSLFNINFTISLIDLSDNSKRKYEADFRYLREYSFEQIYLGNDLFNFSNYNFINSLPFLNTNSSIEYYDENSQYFITTEYFRESQFSSTYYSRIIIYKNNEIVYEQPFEKGRSFSFPSTINLTDNKLVFYQYFEYESVVRCDGYYQLDIVNKTITPLQFESNMYIKSDFFIGNDKSSFISIRPYEIFKITMIE